MALQGAIPIEFGAAFPHGAYAVGEVTAVADFEASTREKPVQQRDKHTGLPVWSVPVMDPDPLARKGQREINVKLVAEFCPSLPDALPGLPFRPVEFTGMTVTPYVDERTKRLMFSYRAAGIQAPTADARQPVEKATKAAA